MTTQSVPHSGSNGTLEAALRLSQIGCSVIPSGAPDNDGKLKVPMVGWTAFETRRPTDEEIRGWDATLHPTLWGYVTGPVSGRIVIDTDNAELKALFEAAGLKPHVKTKRGWHYHFKHPGHFIKTTQGRILPHLDVRGDGGFINCIGHNQDADYEILSWPTNENLYTLEQLPLTVKEAWLRVGEEEVKKARRGGHSNNGHKVPAGERNSRLCSLAGTLKNKGLSREAIFDNLKATYDRDYEHEPPIKDSEIWAIADQSDKWHASDDDESQTMTDSGNKDRFVAQYADRARYCRELKDWFTWDGKRWRRGDSAIYHFAETTARTIYVEAGSARDKEDAARIAAWAKTSESLQRIKAMMELASHAPAIEARVSDLDADPWALNCKNGTVDLRSGEIKDHNPTDLITRLIDLDYKPGKSDKVFEDFLQTIFQDDQETIEFVQRALGYSATGSQDEQAFFFCYGEGWNGKTTLLGACADVLGEYHHECNPAVFMVSDRRGNGPDDEIANLRRVRFLTSTELEDGQKLSVGLVKRATGGEALTSNAKWEHAFTFKPEFKLWLCGNHEPQIADTTNSIWNRMHKIPFNYTVPEGRRVKGFRDILSGQCGEAILAWLIEGAVKCHQDGLGTSQAITEATREYRENQDALHDFIGQCCVVGPDYSVIGSQLYKAYESWCPENGVKYPFGKQTFNSRLREKGYRDRRGVGNKPTWHGIGLAQLVT